MRLGSINSIGTRPIAGLEDHGHHLLLEAHALEAAIALDDVAAEVAAGFRVDFMEANPVAQVPVDREGWMTVRRMKGI